MFCYKPELLQLSHPPYLSGRLVVRMPSEDSYIEALHTSDIAWLVGQMERQNPTEDNQAELSKVTQLLDKLAAENDKGRKWITLLGKYFLDEPMKGSTLEVNRIDLYETPQLPIFAEHIINEMVTVIAKGYERRIWNQEF